LIELILQCDIHHIIYTSDGIQKEGKYGIIGNMIEVYSCKSVIDLQCKCIQILVPAMALFALCSPCFPLEEWSDAHGCMHAAGFPASLAFYTAWAVSHWWLLISIVMGCMILSILCLNWGITGHILNILDIYSSH
jgi:hypothetical protein